MPPLNYSVIFNRNSHHLLTVQLSQPALNWILPPPPPPQWLLQNNRFFILFLEQYIINNAWREFNLISATLLIQTSAYSCIASHCCCFQFLGTPRTHKHLTCHASCSIKVEIPSSHLLSSLERCMVCIDG